MMTLFNYFNLFYEYYIIFTILDLERIVLWDRVHVEMDAGGKNVGNGNYCEIRSTLNLKKTHSYQTYVNNVLNLTRVS